jgi:ornithine cyclodeaminase/alanine dehydrogenase-like protein (mu-crystallin family)
VFVVTASELRRLVPMADAIEAVGAAFRSLSAGEAEQPPRVALAGGAGLAMAARAGTEGDAYKLVSVRPDNRGRGLPTIHALVVWFDGETGEPRLLVEGSALTALRTGAASGYATKLLAAPDASTLAMVGAGAQALDQVRAVCAVRPIERVRVFSPSGVSAAALAERLEVDAQAMPSVAQAVEGADVVCCATNATDPVVPPLTGRVHVNAVGSYRPEMRELPPELLAAAELVAIDERAAALAEAGELIDALARGVLTAAQLVEVGTLAGDLELRGPTVFKSVGVAVQDWAICRLLSERIAAGAPELDLRG